MIARLWSRFGPWMTPALVVCEVVLVIGGVLDVRTAVLVVVALELLIVCTALSRASIGLRRFRSSRCHGSTRWQAVEDGVAQVVPRPLAHAIVVEPQLWACLWQWALRRSARRGRHGFGYGRDVRLILFIVTGVVVVEGAAVDLLIGVLWPGSVWIWVSLGLHVYAIAMLLGIVGSCTVRAHLLLASRIRIQDSVFTQVEIPYAALLAARRIHRSSVGRTGFRVDSADGSAVLGFGDLTIGLVLDPTRPVTVNGQPRDGIRRIWFSVDQADELLAALGSRLRSSRAADAAGRVATIRPVR